MRLMTSTSWLFLFIILVPLHGYSKSGDTGIENLKATSANLTNEKAQSPGIQETKITGAEALTNGPAYKWSIDEVVKIANQQNPDLKSALSNYEAASKIVLEAFSGYLPRVDIEGSFMQTTLPTPSAGSTAQLGFLLPYSAVVGRIKQTLFDFGKVLNEIGASKALKKSAEQQAIAVKNAVELSARKAFYNVSATEKLIDVAERGVVTFEETKRRTAALVRTGTKPSFDLTQANVELSKAKLTLIGAKNAHDLAKIALLNVMGMPKEVNFKLIDAPPTKLEHPDKLALDDLTNKALVNRPELRKSEFAVESAAMRLHREAKDYFPTIALEGFYGKYLPNYPVSLNEAYGGGVVLEWNLFDGLKTTARVGEFSARLDAETAQLEKEKQNIVAEVAQSFLEFKRSETNLDVAKESMTYSQENARLAKRRYEASVSTFLELLVAQTSMLNAQAVAVQAEYQREIALASLRTAVNAPLE